MVDCGASEVRYVYHEWGGNLASVPRTTSQWTGVGLQNGIEGKVALFLRNAVSEEM